MIELYSGTPGSGKSLDIARVIYRRLKAGKPVIANFQINLARIKARHKKFMYIENSDLNPSVLYRISDRYFKGKIIREDEILLVIDEAQLMFNAREWSKQGRSDWLSFFTQHRKYGYKVVLIAQFDRMLDRQIRSVIEYEYVHRKMSNYGIKGQICNILFGGGLMICVKVWYPMNEVVDREFYKAKRKYFKLYNTYKSFGA